MKYLFPLIFLCASIMAHSQSANYPKGVYFTIEDLILNKPSISQELNVVKRSGTALKLAGTNDYRLQSNVKSISKSTINKKTLVYSDGKDMFINCGRYNIQKGYAKASKIAGYYIFSAGLSSNKDLREYQLEQVKKVDFWIAQGGPYIEELSDSDKAMLRFLYAIDSETNRLMLINQESLRKLLVSEDLELLRKYDRDIANIKDKEKVVMAYLATLNYNPIEEDTAVVIKP